MFGCGSPVGTRWVDGRLCNLYRNLDGSQPEYDYWVDYCFPINFMDSEDGCDADIAAGMSQKELLDACRPCIKFTVPDIIKQHQGGLHKSSGAQDLEDTPDIMLYENTTYKVLDPLSWFDANEKYRQQAFAGSKKPPCDKLLLQLGRTNPPKDKAGIRPDDPFQGKVYLNNFTNSPLGKDTITAHIKLFFTMAGVSTDDRCWHFLRRTFIQMCYRAGMQEMAIMRLSRHTSVQGLRTYAGVDDNMMAEYAKARAQACFPKAGNTENLINAAVAINKILPQQPAAAVPSGGTSHSTGSAAGHKRSHSSLTTDGNPTNRLLSRKAAKTSDASNPSSSGATEEDLFFDLDDYDEVRSPLKLVSNQPAQSLPQLPQVPVHSAPNSYPQHNNPSMQPVTINFNMMPAGGMMMQQPYGMPGMGAIAGGMMPGGGMMMQQPYGMPGMGAVAGGVVPGGGMMMIGQQQAVPSNPAGAAPVRVKRNVIMDDDDDC